MGREWWHGAARSVVAETPVELNLQSPVPSLVITSLGALKEAGRPRDIPPLVRWLGSNSGPVAEKAMDALYAINPGRAAEEAQKALEQGFLEPGVRDALTFFLRTHGKAVPSPEATKSRN
jgi:hypothetical protein